MNSKDNVHMILSAQHILYMNTTIRERMRIMSSRVLFSESFPFYLGGASGV